MTDVRMTKFKRNVPDVYAALRAQGWSITMTSKDHVRVTSPDGSKVVVGSMAHVGDPRAIANFTRDCARAGLDLKMTRKPKPLRADTIVQPWDFSKTVQEQFPARPVDVYPDEFWTSEQVEKYLDARKSGAELLQWVKDGRLERLRDDRTKFGYCYLSSDVIAFKNSEFYLMNHKPRRTYTRKSSATNQLQVVAEPVDLPRAPEESREAERTHPLVNVTVARHELLAQELVKAIEPMIKQMVEDVLDRIASGLSARG